MTTPLLSVIICTHNPRQDYFNRTLYGLKHQTLTRDKWELLIIDNKSEPPIYDICDISWHSCARHVREPILGLTPARLRGIRESRGQLLVFVDDDNVLAPDYLSNALHVMSELPELGAVGGVTIGEFEAPPPAWMSMREFEMLGIVGLDKDVVADDEVNRAAVPIGAGLVIRMDVAMEYSRSLSNDPQRRRLDRCGRSLVSGGDYDIVQTALRKNYKIGRFNCLTLVHLIPSFRLTLAYHQDLTEAIEFSNVILFALYGKSYGHWLPRRSPRYWLRRMTFWLHKRTEREILECAAERGIRHGLRTIHR